MSDIYGETHREDSKFRSAPPAAGAGQNKRRPAQRQRGVACAAAERRQGVCQKRAG